MFQTVSWFSMVVIKFNEPDKIITTKIAEDKTNSYEIIALVDLNEPKNAYFELALQPANKTYKNIKKLVYRFVCIVQPLRKNCYRLAQHYEAEPEHRRSGQHNYLLVVVVIVVIVMVVGCDCGVVLAVHSLALLFFPVRKVTCSPLGLA